MVLRRIPYTLRIFKAYERIVDVFFWLLASLQVVKIMKIRMII